MTTQTRLIFVQLLLLMKVNSQVTIQDLEQSWNGTFCKYNDTISLSNCFCDSNCVTFKDCCRDSEYYQHDEQIWGKFHFNCEMLGDMFLYAVASCSEEQEQIDACVHPNETLTDILLDFPVTSNRTGITYINAHCGICNNDFDIMADLLWEIEFSCGDWNRFYFIFENLFAKRNLSLDIHSSVNLDDLKEKSHNCTELDEISWSWKLDLSCTYEKYQLLRGLNESQLEILDLGAQTCDIVSHLPYTILDKLRSCVSNLIATCPTNWSDEDIQTRCESYQDITYKCGLAFRNPYCLFCHNLKNCSMRTETIIPTLPHTRTAYYSNSFRMLLRWNDLDSSRCDEGEIYDKFKRICRKLPKAVSAHEQIKISNQTEKDEHELAYYTKVSHTEDVQIYITNIGLFISILSLLLHLAAFFATPKLMNLPSMNLASLCIALLFLYICFIVSEFVEPPCETLAVIMHYSLVASFVWMLIISFDIWKTIRNSVLSLERSSGNKYQRFTSYSLIGWSFPAFLVTIPLALQLLDIQSWLRPHYGKTNCWINGKHALLTFVMIPLCLVMLLNLCFFSWTSWLIHKTRSKTVSTSTASIDFKLFMRLAFIMGLTWITGIVASFLNHEAVWYIFIFLNSLQGLFIFVAFTCNKKILRELISYMRKEPSTFKTTRTTEITKM